MNDTYTSLDEWCALVERALSDDSDESWRRAADAPLVRSSLPPDSEEALRHAERMADIAARVRARRLLARDELDAVATERRLLVTHSRAVSGYRTTGSPEPIERLLRMMWVG